MSLPPEPDAKLSSADRTQLLEVARRSLQHGLDQGCALPVNPALYSPALREPRASFVTLEINHDLRGCIGSLEARRPLVADVAENSFAAAFRDYRFSPLQPREMDRLTVHISVLSPLIRLPGRAEHEILAQLRPGVDGLLLETGQHRGTFLPSVWESLPDRHSFWRHLKHKAGLPVDYWSDDVEVYRYTTEVIP
jgi:AmmeMemoRadiSam system protein A